MITIVILSKQESDEEGRLSLAPTEVYWSPPSTPGSLSEVDLTLRSEVSRYDLLLQMRNKLNTLIGWFKNTHKTLTKVNAQTKNHTEKLTHTHTLTHAHVHTDTLSHTHTYTYTHTLTHALILAHTRTHTHTHIHTHTHSLSLTSI
jgi:hypothetical protein